MLKQKTNYFSFLYLPPRAWYLIMKETQMLRYALVK